MGKIVIGQFKVKISVIIGWKLNGCNMLCTTALVLVCKQSGDILLTEKLLFSCIIELQNIYSVL
jgi:hypothetical protein